MSDRYDEVATCRGCGMELNGKPYYMGGVAYHPRTLARCKHNYFGGYVCSETCDRNASLVLEMSMPGHQGQRSLSSEVSRRITANWSKE